MFNIVSYHELEEAKKALDTRVEHLEARILVLESTLANLVSWVEHLTDALRGR